jgi:purine-binding chemotaxis protein CheW
MKTQQFCTFFLGPLFLGVEVERVQEVIPQQAMAAVPLAPGVVSGLINLRGQIVMAVDLRRRFGMPEREQGQRHMNVVIRTAAGPLSLLVDEIGDVTITTEDTFERPPETLRADSRTLIRGVHKLKGQLLLVLDAEKSGQLIPIC